MQCRRPLPLTHPELSIISRRGAEEYRVENKHLARDGSGRVITGFSSWTWTDSLIPLLVAAAWSYIWGSYPLAITTAISVVLHLRGRLTQVLWESVIVLPPHGIQLETHRGFPSFPLFVSRRFVSTTTLRDFIINEGLRRWDIRYYLAALTQPDSASFKMYVAYENILPHFPVLVEVYRGVQTTLGLSSCADNPQAG